MGLLRVFSRRLRYLFGRASYDRAMHDEIQFHIESRAEELRDSGLSQRDAFAQARREFGSVVRTGEEARSAWQFPWFEDVAADLRFAMRGFARSRAFTLTAILCLAVGIGGNTV